MPNRLSVHLHKERLPLAHQVSVWPDCLGVTSQPCSLNSRRGGLGMFLTDLTQILARQSWAALETDKSNLIFKG